MNIAVVGIDLGKNSCNLGALDDKGAVVKRRRMRRESIAEFTAKLAPCIVAMEARRGAHRLARRLKSQGPEVRLMSPEYGRPCVKARKNDERDAEAIAEAATRPTMRFVAAKREEQLDTQTLHRARDRLVSERTALINQIRAIVWERGIVLPQGRRPLERELTRRLDASAGIARGDRMLVLIEGMRAEWRSLDERITAFDDELAAQAKHDDRVRRLLSVPGIGVMNATALVAALGNGEAFKRGRDLAAWLGLVPKQRTTGGKPKLGAITKRGNRYLRKPLIHGARAALPWLVKGQTPLGAWRRGPLARAHTNTVIVALANKLARIARATLQRNQEYDAGMGAKVA